MRIHQISMIILGLIWTESALGQNLVRSNAIPVIVQGDTLRRAWAGGIQSPQLSHIDLDNDGQRDIVVFDRLDNRILPFLRIDAGADGLSYAPQFIQNFPPEIYNWMLCTDYDGDGLMDIFCGTEQGSNVLVYRNTSPGQGPLQFQPIPTRLFSDYPPFLALYSAANDLPAIHDIDYDGDLDLLTFNVGGSFVEWHKNLSRELYSHADSLVFEVQSRCFGHFQESSLGCTATIELTPCGSGERRAEEPQSPQTPNLHVGSTLLAIDLNADSLSDLLVGDVGCHDIYSLSNAGTREIAHFNFIESGFPSQSIPIDVFTFPALFSVDLDNDGLTDLVSAPNTASSSEDLRGIQWHKNLGTNEFPNFIHQGYGVLQDGMIEQGTGSHPTFFDYDADGLDDLLIGSLGKFDSSGSYRPSLQLFRNTGTSQVPSFTMVDDDYLGFKSGPGLPQTPGLAPTAGDLDNDGDPDLLIGNQDGTLMLFTNTAPAGNPAILTLTHAQYAAIDVGLNSSPFIYDWDKDQKPDLLIGNAKGRIAYYRNTGTIASPAYTLITDSLGRIKINDASGLSFTNGFAKPIVADCDKDNQDELMVGSITGEVQVFEISGFSEFATFPRQPDLGGMDFGSFSAPAAHKLDTYGLSYLVGTLRGGLELVQDPRSVGTPHRQIATLPSFAIYPNPFENQFTIELPDNSVSANLTILDALGQRLAQLTLESKSIEIPAAEWKAGLYFVVVETSKGRATKKIIKSW